MRKELELKGIWNLINPSYKWSVITILSYYLPYPDEKFLEQKKGTNT